MTYLHELYIGGYMFITSSEHLDSKTPLVLLQYTPLVLLHITPLVLLHITPLVLLQYTPLVLLQYTPLVLLHAFLSLLEMRKRISVCF